MIFRCVDDGYCSLEQANLIQQYTEVQYYVELVLLNHHAKTFYYDPVKW
jgi:hypothetical protein